MGMFYECPMGKNTPEDVTDKFNLRELVDVYKRQFYVDVPQDCTPLESIPCSHSGTITLMAS